MPPRRRPGSPAAGPPHRWQPRARIGGRGPSVSAALPADGLAHDGPSGSQSSTRSDTDPRRRSSAWPHAAGGRPSGRRRALRRSAGARPGPPDALAAAHPERDGGAPHRGVGGTVPAPRQSPPGRSPPSSRLARPGRGAGPARPPHPPRSPVRQGKPDHQPLCSTGMPSSHRCTDHRRPGGRDARAVVAGRPAPHWAGPYGRAALPTRWHSRLRPNRSSWVSFTRTTAVTVSNAVLAPTAVVAAVTPVSGR